VKIDEVKDGNWSVGGKVVTASDIRRLRETPTSSPNQDLIDRNWPARRTVGEISERSSDDPGPSGLTTPLRNNVSDHCKTVTVLTYEHTTKVQ
jgi:hypothetical protein